LLLENVELVDRQLAYDYAHNVYALSRREFGISRLTGYHLSNLRCGIRGQG